MTRRRDREPLADRIERLRRERSVPEADLFSQATPDDPSPQPAPSQTPPPPPPTAPKRDSGLKKPAKKQPHIPTSVDAARSVKHKTGSRTAAVLALIQEHPRTDFEIRELLGDLDAGTATLDTTLEAARCKLRDEGLIRDSGKTRMNPSGRKAILWEAVEQLPLATKRERASTRVQLIDRADRAEGVVDQLRRSCERCEARGHDSIALDEIRSIIDQGTHARRTLPYAKPRFNPATKR
jgi:hypothetical protein